MEVDGMSAVTGVVPNSLGSCYVETPLSKITAAVFGPRQFPPGEVRSEARVNVVVQVEGAAATATSGGGPTDRERALASAIAQGLNASLLLGRAGQFVYDVVVQSHFGGDVSGDYDAGITACSLACADAGLEMRDLISCATVVGGGGAGTGTPAITTATNAGLKVASARLRLASTTTGGGVVHMSQSGVWGKKALEEAVALCVAVNSKRRDLMLTALTK